MQKKNSDILYTPLVINVVFCISEHFIKFRLASFPGHSHKSLGMSLGMKDKIALIYVRRCIELKEEVR